MKTFFFPAFLVLATVSYLPAQVITGGSTTTTYSTVSGNNTLADGLTRTYTGTGDGITFGAGHTLTIDGILSATDTTGAARAVRLANTAGTYTVSIGVNGIVQSGSNDTFQIRNAGTIFNLTNSGQILALTPVPNAPFTANTGQALDLASGNGGTILNNVGALIQADGHDAIRLGNNFTLTNNGSIIGNSKINDGAKNNNATYNASEPFATSEGVSFEDASGSTVINNGIISGTRHGIDAGTATNVVVTNNVGGSIIGKNGSGVGADTTSASASNYTVNNAGLIRGDYAGAGNIFDRAGAASVDGDGDGVDIDGAATINNLATGVIRGTGAGGFDNSGRSNGSDGISIGGGVITNSGVIEGANNGILVNNDTVVSRSGLAATTITNNAGGSITGLNGFAIRLENKLGTAADNDTIINNGTISSSGSIPDPSGVITRQYGEVDGNSVGTLNGTAYTGTGSARFIKGDGAAIQMGEGNDVLQNSGTITSTNGRAVSMEGGNDTVTITGGSASIGGSVDGGAGSDTLNFNLGAGHSFAANATYSNFEQINLNSGKTVVTGSVGVSGTTTVESGAELNVNSGGSVGNVTVKSGGRFSGSGGSAADVVLQSDAVMAPGNSAGTLNAASLTWDGGADFEFELGTVSDAVVLSGALTKGSAGLYEFTFSNVGGLSQGTYDLLTFASTNFTEENFSYSSAISGFGGNFVMTGTQLKFTVSSVPEPSTYLLLCGGLFMSAVWMKSRRKPGKY